MANQHYGRIGDVWKHLPLAEVLAIHRPAEYWESHAGSTRYLLTPSWERDFGVFHFLAGSKQSPLLAASRYRQLLSRYAGFYPGSCEIAMRTLGTASSYLLCDTDLESVRSLAESASELRITSARCEQRDGNDALWLLSVLHTKNNFASLQLFSCIPTKNDFKYPATSFRETTTIAPILSGGCELSHGFAVIDLSLEHPERAQDL